MNLAVFYINLDRDMERRRHMEQMLTEIGFAYERVPAVDGTLTNILEHYDESEAKKKNGAALTPAEIGCAASHREIYRRVVREQLPYALVFEDDIKVTKKFKQITERVIARNEQNHQWDYLTFDYAESGIIFIRRWLVSTYLYYQRYIRDKQGVLESVSYFAVSLVKLLYLVPLTFYESGRNTYYKNREEGAAVKFWRPLYFAGCYLVTLEGAQKLLALSEPHIIYPADRLPNQARTQKNLRFYAYAPIAAKQLRRQFGSNIGIGINFNDDYKETDL